MSAEYLNLRLFIEGIEVPVVSAQVTASVMSPAQAAISIAATDEVHGILPRSVVHLFYFDDKKPVNFKKRAEDSDDKSSDKVSLPTGDVSNPHNWNLLFAGELMSMSFTKDAGARHVVLRCVDFTNYWNSAKIYYRSRSTSNRHFQQAIYAGGVKIRRGKKQANRADDIINILHTKPSTAPTLQGLLGGAVHLLESITGVYDKKSVRRFRGVSDFYAQAELRLRLTKMLGASPKDTSSKLFTGTFEFRRYIRMLSRQMRHSSNFGQLLQVLLSMIQHQHAPVLAPPYIRKGAKATYLKLVPRSSRTHKSIMDAEKELDAIIDTVESALQDREKQVVKKAMVSDPYQSKLIDDGNQSGQEPDTDAQASWKKDWDGQIPTAKAMEERKASFEQLPIEPSFSGAQKTKLNEKARHVADAVSIVKDRLMAETVVNGAEKPKFALHDERGFADALASIEKAKASRMPGRKYKTVSRELEMSDRLVATLFSPNIWMCPPPSCNVIFPDQYAKISFSRNHMSEVSRLWLHGLWRSGRANFNESYFAPNVDVVNGQLSKKDVATAALQSVSFLLPHEKHTGIIPAIEGVGFSGALKKANKVLEKGVDSGGFSKTSLLAGATVKNRGLARAANSKFMDARFATRSAAMTGPFNPGLVCGLPAVILDPVLVSETVTSKGLPTTRGKHYLGRIVSITHSFNRSGAGTSIQMSHCRTHDEGLEIFGDKNEFEATVKLEKKIKKGTRVKSGGKLYAEVHGWRVRQETVTVNGRKISRGYAEPILGMRGTRGSTGTHITQGLIIQGAIVDHTLDTGTGKKTKISPSEVANGTLSGGEVAFEFAPKTPYKAIASRKSGTTGPRPDNVSQGSVVIPNRITRDKEFIDGYEYRPPLPWMDSSALGAVVIDAYAAGNTPGVKKRKFKFTFEQIARYPWLAPIYLNQNIGPEFYQEMLGCSSIVDVTGVQHLVPANKGGYGFQSGDNPSFTDYQSQVRDFLRGEDPSLDDLVEIEGPDGYSIKAPVGLLGGVPIELAVENLAALYHKYVKSDVNLRGFINTYTRRGHATMVDMFGLGWKTDEVVGTRYLNQLDRYRSESGDFRTGSRPDAKDGFHSYAFGDVENLSNIKYVPTEAIPDTLNQERRPINPKVDPRKDRYAAVTEYRRSLGIKGTRG